IVKVKEAVGDAHLKVILETGELGTYDNVRRASLLAMAAGADFIKTSTGKGNPAATLPVALSLREAHRAGHQQTGAPGRADAAGLQERSGHFVGGDWLEPAETYTTISPSSEEPLAEVGQATPAEVDRAVVAARAAFEDGWSGLPASERAKYLFRIARILQE